MKNLDFILKRVVSLSLSCEGLTRVIRDFEDVLNKEHAAISRSDIKELEEITQHKIFFGGKVDEGIKDIKKLIGVLGLELNVRTEEGSELQLTPLLQALRNLNLVDRQEAEAKLDALSKAVEHLRSARSEIFPKIEANAYLVNRLLQYHRETYAFWQSIAQDSEAVYSKNGKTKASGQRSILSVRT